jgi:hypothetical protein
MILKQIGAILLAWGLVFTPSFAHETWAERVILIHYGEPGGPLDAYKPEQIGELSAIDRDGKPLAITARSIGGAAVAVTAATGDPAAVFYAMQLGHYVITGEDWKPATAQEAAAAGKSWTGLFTATSILTWHPSLAQSRQRAIELVPLTDPAMVPVGQPLRLRAYRQGKPVVGVQVSGGDGKPPLVSDADGLLSVPVRSGHQVILGSLDEVVDGRTKGWLAILSFRCP